MLSSDLLKATAPVGGSSTIYSGSFSPGSGVSYGYSTVASGVGIGTVTISADEIKALTTPAPSNRMSLTVENGEPSVLFQELQDDGTSVQARLEPDSSMSASDLAKVMMLISVAKENAAYLGTQLKPISYIRKHNLERHFRFSAA